MIEDAIGNGSDAIRISEEQYNMIKEIQQTDDEFYKDMELDSDGVCNNYLRFRNFKKPISNGKMNEIILICFVIILFGVCLFTT